MTILIIYYVYILYMSCIYIVFSFQNSSIHFIKYFDILSKIMSRSAHIHGICAVYITCICW
jgi:hypothetical protein